MTISRALDEAEAALATVVCRGHYDTCSCALSEEYACSCPWAVAREAIEIIRLARADVTQKESSQTMQPRG